MPQQPLLRILLVLLTLAVVTTSSAFAQGYVIRIDDAEMVDGERLSFGTLVCGLHVIAPGEEEIQEVVLFSALVVVDEVLEMGQPPFLAAATATEWPPEEYGLTLRDAGIELGNEYRKRRAVGLGGFGGVHPRIVDRFDPRA